MQRWLVDGTNLMGTRPDGWWRDRAGAAARIVDELRTLVRQGDQVAVVFDGRESDALREGSRDGVTVFFAGRSGRDAADDRIFELVAAEPDPVDLVVVTSDRNLAERVRALGAKVKGSGSFRRELDRKSD